MAGLTISVGFQGTPADAALGRWLRRRLARAAALQRRRRGELGLVIVGRRRMAQLHRRHLGQPGATDVLTFDLRDGPRQPLLGEIVVCRDVAAAEARRRGHAPRLELLLYALHGLLHLTGHDDHAPAAAARMHRREDALLQRLRLPAVYRRPRVAKRARAV